MEFVSGHVHCAESAEEMRVARARGVRHLGQLDTATPLGQTTSLQDLSVNHGFYTHFSQHMSYYIKMFG